jgi:hypothetical protein
MWSVWFKMCRCKSRVSCIGVGQRGHNRRTDRSVAFVRCSHRYEQKALVRVETNNSNKSPELGMGGIENVRNKWITPGFGPFIHDVNKRDALGRAERPCIHLQIQIGWFRIPSFFCYSSCEHKYIFQVHRNLLETFHRNSLTWWKTFPTISYC